MHTNSFPKTIGESHALQSVLWSGNIPVYNRVLTVLWGHCHHLQKLSWFLGGRRDYCLIIQQSWKLRFQRRQMACWTGGWNRQTWNHKRHVIICLLQLWTVWDSTSDVWTLENRLEHGIKKNASFTFSLHENGSAMLYLKSERSFFWDLDSQSDIDKL